MYSQTPNLTLRLRAYKARQKQRGAILFLVVMIVTLLSAVGLYAMGAASLANQAIGFNRQGMRTFYAADFASRSFAAYMAGREGELVQVRADDPTCEANVAVAARNVALAAGGKDVIPVYCKRKENGDLFRDLDFADVGSGATMLGQLSYRTPFVGTFDIELTDVFDAGKPVVGSPNGDGSSPNLNFTYKIATLTTTAIIRPQIDENSTDAAILSSSSVQRMRATVLFGPVLQ